MRHEGELVTTAAPTGGGAAVAEVVRVDPASGTGGPVEAGAPSGVRRDGFTLYAEIYAIRLALPG